MSKLGLPIVAVLVMLSLIPFVFVARSRASKSATPAQNPVADMDLQSRFNTQSASPLFKDGRSMRPQVAGTLAQEDLKIEPEILNDPTNPRLINGEDNVISLDNPVVHAAIAYGRTRGANETDQQFDAAKPVNLTNPAATDADIAKDTFYVRTIPSQIKVTADFVHRGEERFNIYCMPCHGQSGYGDGPVWHRSNAIKEASAPGRESQLIDPQNLHDPKIVSRPDGNIFNTITNGVRTMPPYDKQISVMDRWAIIAYVRALQTSQHAPQELTQNR